MLPAPPVTRTVAIRRRILAGSPASTPSNELLTVPGLRRFAARASADRRSRRRVRRVQTGVLVERRATRPQPVRALLPVRRPRPAPAPPGAEPLVPAQPAAALQRLSRSRRQAAGAVEARVLG